jgi:hypothetical protein
MESIITYIQLAIFIFYVGYVWLKVGVLPSISESYYQINERWMFTIILCWGLGLSNVMRGSEWYFFSGAALCFTGAASSFKDWSVTKHVHNAGAVLCILLSIIGLAYQGVYYTAVPIVAFSLVAILSKMPNRIWWIEVVAFLSIISGFFCL